MLVSTAARRLSIPEAEIHDLAALLERARHRAALGQDVQARDLCVFVIARDPCHLEAPLEFGHLALAGNYRAAARTAHERVVRFYPHHLAARINLGNILFDFSEHVAAGEQFQAALALEPMSSEAHRGRLRGMIAIQLKMNSHRWNIGMDCAINNRRTDDV